MIRYIPPYKELKADAELLLRGFVNKVRCDNCGYRLTWATDTEVENGKPIYTICTCGQDPAYYTNPLGDITYGDLSKAWKTIFGDMYPIDTKPYSYIFDRFIQSLFTIQFIKRENAKAQEELEARKEVKKT